MRLLVGFCLLLVTAAAPAQESERNRWTGSGDYDPGPGQPLGRKSPLAPPELAEFAFMLGSFDCHDRIPREGGKVLEFDSTWNATSPASRSTTCACASWCTT